MDENTQKQGVETKADFQEPAKAASPSISLEDLETKASERAQRKLLADLGLEDLDSAKKIFESHRKSELEKLSEGERTAKLLKEQLDARAKHEADIKELRAQVREYETKFEQITLFAQHGVKPGDAELVGFLLKTELAKNKQLDRTEFLEKLKAERPYLFGEVAAPKFATTGTSPVKGPTLPAQPSSPFFDAMDPSVTPQQLKEIRSKANSFRHGI